MNIIYIRKVLALGLLESNHKLIQYLDKNPYQTAAELSIVLEEKYQTVVGRLRNLCHYGLVIKQSTVYKLSNTSTNEDLKKINQDIIKKYNA